MSYPCGSLLGSSALGALQFERRPRAWEPLRDPVTDRAKAQSVTVDVHIPAVTAPIAGRPIEAEVRALSANRILA